MLAHYFASSFLISLGLVPLFAAEPAGPDLQIYIKTGGIAPAIRLEMEKQTDIIMKNAGFDAGWWESREDLKVTHAQLLVIEFKGQCKPSPAADVRRFAGNFSQLAASAVTDGRVLPFIQVDCAGLARLLNPKLASQSRTKQEKLYARAMARVLAHEIYHVVAQTTLHTSKGLTKARVCAEELTSENFGFTEVALGRLRTQRRSHEAGVRVATAGGM